MILAILFLAAPPAHAQCLTDLVQDLNCNTIEPEDEPLVDLEDKLCLSTRDDYGNPFPNADYYFDYASYKCEVPIVDFDEDGDGFGAGVVSVPPESPYPDIVAVLDCDNCPQHFNPVQEDADCDNVGDLCDNCPDIPNNDQQDTDSDGEGDACDPCPFVPGNLADDDQDGLQNACDNCPQEPNMEQLDSDNDLIGDVCDICPFVLDDGSDLDNDGAGDPCDNCLELANPLQEDQDFDSLGDACDVCPEIPDPNQQDSDNDGAGDACDVCPATADPDQANSDGDRFGDACDNCPSVDNHDQADRDGDGTGDRCDTCPDIANADQADQDGDEIGDLCDNCPRTFNPDQKDVDGDGDGNECDNNPKLRGGSCDSSGGAPLGVLALMGLALARRRRFMAPSVALLVVPLIFLGGCNPFAAPEFGIGEQIEDTDDDCELAACDTTPEPCIELDPVVLNFGIVILDDPPKQLTLSVNNPCDGELLIEEMVIADPDAPYVLDGAIEAVEPGDTATVDVTFAPAEVGMWVSSVLITSNDPLLPDEVVSLAGEAACNIDRLDSDFDGVQDGCDICEAGPDHIDTDLDTVPDACDVCPWQDDTLDADLDSVPDACDVCPDGDDLVDDDEDLVPDDCDSCLGFDDALDEDEDGSADGCDLCPGFDDRIEVDGDGVPDGCDACPGFDDNADADKDGVADGCDVCAGYDDAIDTDGDGIADGCDLCEGADDFLDTDLDGVPNGCDECAIGDDAEDADGDSVPDACDLCPGEDDLYDPDGDGFPDACDPCPGYPDDDDEDQDGIPDGCDACPGFDDRLDADNDLVPDACDQCEGFPDPMDDDGDLTPNGCDLCEGYDDGVDSDMDAVPDGCDLCEGFPDYEDGDYDSIPNACDQCPGHDDRDDSDGDLVPDMCDSCEGGDDNYDADYDLVPDACDVCDGGDDNLDDDADSVPDHCDLCPGEDDLQDEDADLTPDGCDVCPGYSDSEESDGDGIPDGCDLCPGGDDANDEDEDGVADYCDMCPDFPDDQDLDRDGIPDACDACPGFDEVDVYPPNEMALSDLVFVVDNSCSMAQEQAALGNNFVDFIDAMTAAGADWRVGVITTDRSQFVGPFIRSDDPNNAQQFANQVNVGTNGSGNERGIQMAYNCSAAGGDCSPGRPFWREDAVFAVVFVSDERDQSNVTPQQALNRWVGQKGGDITRVVAHAIVGDVPGGCPDADPGDGYDDIVDISGGHLLSICDQNWGDDLAAIAKASLADLVYPLEEVPVPATIVVFDDGVPTTAGWVYDRTQNAVVFDGTNRPEPGSLVTIEYVLDCDGQIGACNDGIDNDNDGYVDFPEEPGCVDIWDTNENDPVADPQCFDGLDNDGDGDGDWPDDRECESAAHEDEACEAVSADAFGYRLCEKWPEEPICPDLSLSGIPLPLGDEGVVLTQMGFEFDFYGKLHTEVYVGANGTLNFANPLSEPTNLCMPAPSEDNAILAYWDDLNPAAGQVLVRSSGVPPQRTFNVQWLAPHVNGVSNIDLRVVLHESKNDIDVCYVQTDLGANLNDGMSATVGIQGTNTVYLDYGCFAQDLVESGLVLHYDHPYGY